MVEDGPEIGVDDKISDVDRYMFEKFVYMFFAKGVKPGERSLVFVREKLYALEYYVMDSGVCRVFIFDGDVPSASLAFDFHIKNKSLLLAFPDLDSVKSWMESFTVAGHW